MGCRKVKGNELATLRNHEGKIARGEKLCDQEKDVFKDLYERFYKKKANI